MNTETIEPEVVDQDEPMALERRSPAIPVTLAELAALKGEAMEIIEARIQVLETLRKAAIRATSPEDWLLFKSDDGNVTAYLQDCGADRVRDLYGIEIFEVGIPQKISGTQEGFTYIISGSGRCKLTKQTLENVEGGRSSTDDFCKHKKGAELELSVRKAARANLDGNITRELAGLKNVPLNELQSAWTGSNKNSSRCRLGRGFGTQQERRGAVVHDGDKTEEVGPKCPKCGAKMNFRAAGKTSSGKEYSAFWGCSKFKSDGCKGSVQDSDYRQSLRFGEGADPDPMTERAPGEEG
jgi:hypothetical protein